MFREKCKMDINTEGRIKEKKGNRGYTIKVCERCGEEFKTNRKDFIYCKGCIKK